MIEKKLDPKNKEYIEKIRHKIERLSRRALGQLSIGNFKKVKNLIDNVDYLIESLPLPLPKEVLESISRFYTLKGNLYFYKGDLNLGKEFQQKALSYAKKINNNNVIALALNNLAMCYRNMGDLQQAITAIEQALLFLDKINDKPLKNHHFIAFLDTALSISLLMNNLERAKRHLSMMDQIINEDKNTAKKKEIQIMYKLSKAKILKFNPRAQNIVTAEKLLREIIEDEVVDIGITFEAFLNLYDLYLIELRNTGDREILNQLKPFLEQLLDLAEEKQSYSLLAEVFLLHAKMHLLEFKFNEANRFLIQAQRIAEKRNLNQLVKKISKQQEYLRNNIEIWKGMKESEVSFSDRIKIVQLEEQIQDMLNNRMLLTARITEGKISVHKERKICLVCKGEVERFNIYICPECNSIYCQNCAQALVDLENLCWSCNASIDPSRPIKPYDKEDNMEISPNKDRDTPKKFE